MKVSEIAKLLEAEYLCGEEQRDMEILCACGADMMSDVLAFTKHDAREQSCDPYSRDDGYSLRVVCARKASGAGYHRYGKRTRYDIACNR